MTTDTKLLKEILGKVAKIEGLTAPLSLVYDEMVRRADNFNETNRFEYIQNILTANFAAIRKALDISGDPLVQMQNENRIRSGLRINLGKAFTERDELLKNQEYQMKTIARINEGSGYDTLSSYGYKVFKERRVRIDQLNEEIGVLKKRLQSLDGLEMVNEKVKDFSNVVKETGESAKIGATNFSQIGESVNDALSSVLGGLRITGDSNLDGLLHKIGGGFIKDVFGGIFGNIFGGFRAGGGGVGAGRAYVVGENGPELFVPGRQGNILSNAALKSRGGGGSGVVVNVHNTAGASVDVQPKNRRSNGMDLDIRVLDRAVAKTLATPGSQARRTMEVLYGARPVLTSR